MGTRAEAHALFQHEGLNLRRSVQVRKISHERDFRILFISSARAN